MSAIKNWQVKDMCFRGEPLELRVFPGQDNQFKVVFTLFTTGYLATNGTQLNHYIG